MTTLKVQSFAGTNFRERWPSKLSFAGINFREEKLKDLTFEKCPCNICREYVDGVGYID